ncbi:hypothetical protein [Bacillus sp. AK031]
MFDPTAYENLKVVLQGALYELELSGSLKITDRKDIIDLASLERRFSLTVSDPDVDNVSAVISLLAGIKEWNAEAHPFENGIPGAWLQVLYQSEGKLFSDETINRLEEWWGPERTLEWTEIKSSINPLQHICKVNFNRIITEEMVDDLEEVAVHIENSLLNII